MMNRRHFLHGAATLAAAGRIPAALTVPQPELYVSPNGSDSGPGTFAAPLATLAGALTRSREIKRRTGRPALILLRKGTYPLSSPIHLTAADAGTQEFPLRIEAYAAEEVVISGGTRLCPTWKPYRDGIFQAQLARGTTTDQLFLNGLRQVLARYPNADPHAHYLDGTAADALSPERTRRYRHPEDGFVHAMQQSLWGSLSYRITGRNPDGTLALEGGWQIDRDQPMHNEFRFIEGIFEELDAPGEWYLNPRTFVLYVYPPAGLDLATATVDIVRLENLLAIGDRDGAATRGITLRGLTFRHTLRTFMKTREQLLRSDWRIYRGGVLLLENAEDVLLDRCFLDQSGGNAVFISGHARRITVQSSRIENAGASGICFVGRPSSVRNALLGYTQTQSLADIDHSPGPRNGEYPADSLVDDCLITRTGCIEKQTAPVEISTAQSIRVSHCSLYEVPRAGINIGDGCFGGHRIENCDVFDTVLETSDHGAFNSWGRDRWWHLRGAPEDTLLTNAATQSLPTIDAALPTVLADTRWACEHGWDIDLDDGSSNYRIHRNLCLCGGLKLREGFFRVAENNVLVNNTLHVHVWPADSEDIFRRNIVFVPYLPIQPRGWGADFDLNLLHHPGLHPPRPAVQLQQLSGQDQHSIEADALFVAPEHGNFSLQPASPAFALGFENLATNVYGVRSPELRALARIPDIPRLLNTIPATLRVVRHKDTTAWMGATVRNLVGLGEMSEFGAPAETGVLFESVPAKSSAAAAGLQSDDLLLEAAGVSIPDTATLTSLTVTWRSGEHIPVRILRAQHPRGLMLAVP